MEEYDGFLNINPGNIAPCSSRIFVLVVAERSGEKKEEPGSGNKKFEEGVESNHLSETSLGN